MLLSFKKRLKGLEVNILWLVSYIPVFIHKLAILSQIHSCNLRCRQVLLFFSRSNAVHFNPIECKSPCFTPILRETKPEKCGMFSMNDCRKIFLPRRNDTTSIFFSSSNKRFVGKLNNHSIFQCSWIIVNWLAVVRQDSCRRRAIVVWNHDLMTMGELI